MMSKKLGVALALLLGATSVSFATGATNSSNTTPPPSTQSPSHRTMRTSHQTMHARRLYNYAPSGLEQTAPSAAVPGQAMTPGGESARAAALRDCSAKANKWSFSAWQTTQLAVYGECMSQHGQVG